MIRKAKINDAKQIHALISLWAQKGKVLERSLNYIYENIRDFWVYSEKNKIIACCALGVVGWEGLAEIKSLVVLSSHQGKSIGKKLVKKVLSETQSLGVKKVFALTFVPVFFKKIGFRKIDREKLPHKIWSDCINCVHFPNCCEEAVMLNLTTKRRV